ncbi:MAG: AAA family ATPase [Endomicrobium sp.]|jgi:dephospho-CoA kinase|nr:AAA family ATPase [Endomicrobium sp.]
MIVGLTGFCCSGKDTIAIYLTEKYGYEHYSLSDVIREMMVRISVEPSRENMISWGNQLRKNEGNGILARKVLENNRLSSNCCITSIRHPDEVIELKKSNFILVNVDATRHIRFSRMRSRNRAGDPSTIEKFVEFEERELQIDGHGQQLMRTINMADITFVNNFSSISLLKVSVDGLVKNLKSRY